MTYPFAAIIIVASKHARNAYQYVIKIFFTIEKNLSSPPVLPGSDLRVQRRDVEQHRRLLERDRPLAGRHPRQGVVPLEVDPEGSVGREEAPLHKVELVEVLEQQGDACGERGNVIFLLIQKKNNYSRLSMVTQLVRALFWLRYFKRKTSSVFFGGEMNALTRRVPCRRPHRLPDVHELRHRVLEVRPLLGIVLGDEVEEGLAEVDLLGLLEAEGDHWDLAVPDDKNNNVFKFEFL